MNLRFVLPAITVATATLALLHPQAGATVKKPVALQYDEIVRMAMAPNTPPPPGAFQGDYQTIVGGAGPMSAAATASPTPSPAPRKHGLFGQIASVMSGNIPGAGGDDNNGGDAGSYGMGGAYAGAMAKMKALQNGTLTRLTYYKNWIRTDDPVGHTATISKCDLHQFISLDLAKRTYHIENTAPKCVPAPAPVAAGPGRTYVENEAPGTGDITISATDTNIGPKTLDGIPTQGYNTSLGYATTNATGSCKNGSMKMLTEKYVSQIAVPRPYCPLPRTAPVPASPDSYVVHGGCKPRMHGSMSGLGADPSRGSEMYMKLMYGGGGSDDQSRGVGQFATVTERGNVKWIQEPAADALFSVPPGFTKT